MPIALAAWVATGAAHMHTATGVRVQRGAGPYLWDHWASQGQSQGEYQGNGNGEGMAAKGMATKGMATKGMATKGMATKGMATKGPAAHRLRGLPDDGKTVIKARSYSAPPAGDVTLPGGPGDAVLSNTATPRDTVMTH